jgi:hypothetical protein
MWLTTVATPAIADDNPSPILKIGQFSKARLSDLTPRGWQPLVFDKIERHTAYFLSRYQGRTVVKAYSENAASGLFRKVDIDPNHYPLIHWQWKIDNLIENADLHSKAGDDYPARIYVSFDYDTDRLSEFERFKLQVYTMLQGEAPPLAVINYVWDNKNPVNTVVPNAYTDRVKMIVVQSGQEAVGQWRRESRNIYQDYVNAFGETPLKITGIALMTDTDNTHSRASSLYGDISFSHAATEM